MIRDKFNGVLNQKRNILVGNHQHLFILIEKAFLGDAISEVILIIDLREIQNCRKGEVRKTKRKVWERQGVDLKRNNCRLTRS